MRTAFITGGGGYVGRTLAKALVKDYDKIIVFERPGVDSSWIDNHKIHMKYGDIRNQEHLRSVIEKGSHVYHLAALGGSRRVSFKTYYDINVAGTKTVFDVSIESGASKFFFMSSSAAVGPQKFPPMNEDTVCHPTSLYGRTKREAEKYILSHSKGMITSIIFRAPVIYGPNPHKDSGAYSLVKLAKLKVYPVFAGGNNTIMLCNIHNLVAGIKTAMNVDNQDANVFFVSDPNNYTFNEMIHILHGLLGSQGKALHLPSAALGLMYYLTNFVANISRYNVGIPHDVYQGLVSNAMVFSTDKLKNLGYLPLVTLEEGYAEVIKSIEGK